MEYLLEDASQEVGDLYCDGLLEWEEFTVACKVLAFVEVFDRSYS